MSLRAKCDYCSRRTRYRVEAGPRARQGVCICMSQIPRSAGLLEVMSRRREGGEDGEDSSSLKSEESNGKERGRQG